MKVHLRVLQQIISTSSSLVILITSTLVYLLLTSIILNYKLFASFYQTSVSIREKIEVTPAILIQTLDLQSPAMLVFHILIALLFALNIVLITQKVTTINNPSLKFGVGAGIISLATAGCASCGLSLLTILGLGSALTLLPFEGIEILALTTIILTLTFIYNLSTITRVCKIDKNGKKLSVTGKNT